MRGMVIATVLVGVASGVLFAVLPARADGPDLDGAMSLMKGALKGTLVNEGACRFRATPPGGKTGHVFHAGALEVVASDMTASSVRFDCRKQQSCVTASDGKTADGITLEVHGDPPSAALAISRVVEMCSGAGH